jgi:DNA-binding response OmpR family regulator
LPPSDVGSADQRRTVLLIEDDANVAHLAKVFLSRAGYDVILAANGNTGLAVGADAKLRLDAAIVDLGLPDLAGDRIVKRIVELRPECAIVVATGSYDSYGEHRDVWLAKPFRMGELVAAVEQAIAKHRAHVLAGREA